jgi:hypothetical protein
MAMLAFSSNLKIEAVYSFETLVEFYQTIGSYIPKRAFFIIISAGISDLVQLTFCIPVTNANRECVIFHHGKYVEQQKK